MTFMVSSGLAGALLVTAAVLGLGHHPAAGWLTGAASLLIWSIGLLIVWPVLRAIRAGSDPTGPDLEGPNRPGST
ncbi:hypothetical protein [Asanoa iriomotensis]|uniref:Uncharacterized protein n=1 Tax=Asanoa iriomotensis TaxID=234613 RepID=A0ABQ4C2A1_9ACTN|nr:hypothetical protein [Asanoa iriomotensis]GIF56910.1 hypothetical protein Air01nite_30050 [Asanoa iriomotensis]